MKVTTHRPKGLSTFSAIPILIVVHFFLKVFRNVLIVIAVSQISYLSQGDIRKSPLASRYTH